MRTNSRPQLLRIRLKPREFFLQKGIDIPGSVWARAQFPFKPQPFGIGGDRLHEKLFDPSVQSASLDRFLEDPARPLVYGVSSAPDDTTAKYFAAFLVQSYLEAVHASQAQVLWARLDSGYENKFVNQEPSLLVITGLCPNSTVVKLEKARDLLEQNSHIPRIVVVAGEDPITFFKTRLYYPIHNLFFHSNEIVKRKVEVI